MTVATVGPPPAQRPAAGLLAGCLPFNPIGHGAKTLVVLQGLAFENQPLDRTNQFARDVLAFLCEHD